jgi:hypothetical protein
VLNQLKMETDLFAGLSGMIRPHACFCRNPAEVFRQPEKNLSIQGIAFVNSNYLHQFCCHYK